MSEVESFLMLFQLMVTGGLGVPGVLACVMVHMVIVYSTGVGLVTIPLPLAEVTHVRAQLHRSNSVNA